jgi:uncharacterized membrane protein
MIREILRWLLAGLMVFIGVLHFTHTAALVPVVPAFLPAPEALVYISGVFEILGGIGLVIPKLSRAAGWGLIALYIAVFPANVNMAINQIPMGDLQMSPTMLWARLPLQFVIIAWAYWYARRP